MCRRRGAVALALLVAALATLQLGGDFVVGRDGMLTYARPQRADDRPPVADLIRALAAAAKQPHTGTTCCGEVEPTA